MSENSAAPGRMTGVLAEVAAVAGATAARQLARELGGSRVYVSKTPRAGSLLTEAVGIEAAKKIAGRYGGENIYIPLDARARRQRRIFDLVDSGASVYEAARTLGIDRRTIQRALRSRRSPSVNNA